MNKEKELAKNTVIITIGKIATQFISFFLLPLYTSALSTEEYGTVELCVTYTSLLLPIVLCQMDQGLFRFLVDMRKDEKEKKNILTTVYLFAALQICLVTILFLAIQGFVHSDVKWFLFFNVIASVVANLMLQTARGLGDYIGYAGGSFLSATWQIAGNIIGILVFHKGVYGMLEATISANFATGLFLFCREKMWNNIKKKSFHKDLLREVLKYSLPLIPNALSWWMINASDRTIVFIMMGTSYTGLLSVGHKFPSVCITAYNLFHLSWLESASMHMNDADKDEFFSGVINTMFRVFMSLAIGIIACMPFVFPIMINGKFNGIYNVIPIYMIATMLHVIIGLYTVIYVALKKTTEIAKTALYSAIINVVVHIALINWIGLYASAISTVVAFGCMVLYRYIDLKRYIDIKLEHTAVGSVVLLYGISCISYYCHNTVMQGMILILVVAGVALLNRKFLMSCLKMVKEGKLFSKGRKR